MNDKPTPTRDHCCDCCRPYGCPGMILNAGAWLHCPQCDKQYVKSGEYDKWYDGTPKGDKA